MQGGREPDRGARQPGLRTSNPCFVPRSAGKNKLIHIKMSLRSVLGLKETRVLLPGMFSEGPFELQDSIWRQE